MARPRARHPTASIEQAVEVYLQGILPEDRTTRQRWADRLHADPRRSCRPPGGDGLGLSRRGAKNISMLLTPGDTVVAPLYDLATGLVYDGGQVHRQVAISIGGDRDFGSVNIRHWDKAAAVLGLPPAQYWERVRRLAERFTDALSAELDRVGTTEASDVKARDMDAMARHAHHVIAGL